jgi:hypothetical protein
MVPGLWPSGHDKEIEGMCVLARFVVMPITIKTARDRMTWSLRSAEFIPPLWWLEIGTTKPPKSKLNFTQRNLMPLDWGAETETQEFNPDT